MLKKIIKFLLPYGTKRRKLIKKIYCEFVHHCKFKLGISYNLYDGEELLEYSLNSIKNVASYICVVYENVSNKGEIRIQKIDNLLANLKNKKLINEYYLYTPNLSLPAYQNERNMRICGLKLCKKNKCTHFISMDVDEFYDEKEMGNAIQFIQKNKIDATAVSIIEYIKDPIYQLPFNYTYCPNNSNKLYYTFYVPFIHRIHRINSMLTDFYPCLVDRTRMLNGNKKFYLFSKHIIAMHHMSTIRKNLNLKYSNSTISLSSDIDKNNLLNLKYKIYNYNFSLSKKIPNDFAFFDDYPVKKVNNKFNIHI